MQRQMKLKSISINQLNNHGLFSVRAFFISIDRIQTWWVFYSLSC